MCTAAYLSRRDFEKDNITIRAGNTSLARGFDFSRRLEVPLQQNKATIPKSLERAGPDSGLHETSQHQQKGLQKKSFECSKPAPTVPTAAEGKGELRNPPCCARPSASGRVFRTFTRLLTNNAYCQRQICSFSCKSHSSVFYFSGRFCLLSFCLKIPCQRKNNPPKAAIKRRQKRKIRPPPSTHLLFVL